MSSNGSGKKFTLNFPSTTRYFKRRAGESNGWTAATRQSSQRSNTSDTPSHGWLSPAGLSTPPVGTAATRRDGVSSSPTTSTLHRSNSTGNMELSPATDDVISACSGGGVGELGEGGAPEGEEEMLALTRDVQRFSEALSGLKSAVSPASTDVSEEEIHVEVHRRLNDVLAVLKEILNKYRSLYTADVLTATNSLITACKDAGASSSDGMTSPNSSELIVSSIDHVALAISACVSDYWMTEVENSTSGNGCDSGGMIKTKSLDCLHDTAATSASLRDITNCSSAVRQIVGDGLDAVLHKLESGVELALIRAQAWSKYTKDLVSYIERRSNMWAEFTRNIQKLSKSVQQAISEDSFLPFQSIYTTALNQDIELASMSQAARSLIQNSTFIGPLNARRAEHDKIRKNLKATWTKQLRKMHDTVANMRKARATYIGRQQEYEKLRAEAMKAESESISLSAAGGAVGAKADARVEKKKKMEDDAMQKAIEAEAAYKMSVEESNITQQQLVQLKWSVLREVRELLDVSDHELKLASVGYFKLMNTITDTIPQQFINLSDNCRNYQPGSHYAEFVRRLRPQDHPVAVVEPFVFEPYPVAGRPYDETSSITTRDDLGSAGYHSANTTLDSRGTGGGGGGATRGGGTFKLEDSDSISGGSSLSLESSPTTSPHQGHRRRALAVNAAIGELHETTGDDEHRFYSLDEGSGASTFDGVRLSGAARTHVLRKLRAPSRCRECDGYVYFQGADCEKCGMASHKKCLETLRAVCSSQTPSSASSASSAGLVAGATLFDVPDLVKKCIREINRRGLNVKGIYRVSGVKSKVEQVCQSFDSAGEAIDLSDQHPNVIANVLKLYLRQLPEPLFTYRVYPMLIQFAKDDLQGGVASLSTLSQLVEQLPLANYKTCVALMHHLSRVSKHQDTNQMSASNLGIVFGPTLLRPREGPGSLDYLIDTPYQTRIIELLINNVQAIFGAEDTSGADCSPDPAAATNHLDVDSTDQLTEDAISPTITSWYAPELTGDLLQELAKEEPHFQQLQHGSTSQRQLAATGVVTEKSVDTEHSSSLSSSTAASATASASPLAPLATAEDKGEDDVYSI